MLPKLRKVIFHNIFSFPYYYFGNKHSFGEYQGRLWNDFLYTIHNLMSSRSRNDPSMIALLHIMIHGYLHNFHNINMYIGFRSYV